jgi:hypothetical protein
MRRINGKINKEYRAWKAMKARCYSNCHKDKNYQLNNIQVCDSWKNSFEQFFNDMGNCPEGYSLDRIDNKGNYEPSNCRWVNHTVQSNNRSEFNLLYELNGDVKTLKEWSKTLNIKYTTLYMRIFRQNMNFNEAINVNTEDKLTLYKGERKSIKEWCEILNLPYKTIINRKHDGWSIEKCFETPIKVKI